MNLFLDTSVLLAAAGSELGASAEIFRRASAQNWSLISTRFILHEVQHNIHKLPPAAGIRWPLLLATLQLRDDVLTIDRPVLFDASKDKPVLFAALAWANTLLTLDQKDFASITNQPFYGLHILTPGNFLRRERTAGRLT